MSNCPTTGVPTQFCTCVQCQKPAEPVAASHNAPYVEECRAHMASEKPRHPDVLKELHRIHRLMHAGKPYAFEQSLLCELICEIERLRGASNNNGRKC